MNIFVLHPNPRKSARWHVDRHVVKMLLETCQLLYTTHWVIAFPQLKQCKSPISLAKFHKTLQEPKSLKTAPVALSSGEHYRPCHVLHPCARWTRQTLGNYLWLCRLGIELAREFRHRFGHVHSCEEHVQWLYANPPPGIRQLPKSYFIMAMDEQYKISGDPIRSYRNYYKTSKKERGLVKYTKRQVPHWLR
jgi:hypothetical protein